ncbi:MAG TPA: hypothetical protein PLS83_12465, partial [Methanothrix soehngenii]|nr:hypothetical protein [Methanothrix soehngenii]
MAFTISALYGWLMAQWGVVALVCIIIMTVLVVLRNLKIHRSREQIQSEAEIFNLRKISDPKASVLATFEHMGIFLSVIEEQLDRAFQGLIQCDRHLLKDVRRHTKRIQGWANIIIANIFKVLRLLHHSEQARSQNYAQIISTLQEIAESHRDLVVRAFTHIDNHHKGFLPIQIEEIRKIHQETLSVLHAGAEMLRNHSQLALEPLEGTCRRIGQMLREFDQNQIVRIQDESSKTRLSILFYSFIWNDQKIARKTLELLRVFQEALHLEDSDGNV